METKKVKLTQEQKKIVRSRSKKKVVVAGPGTGKTTLLLAIARAILEYMEDEDIESERGRQKVLLLSFSKQTVDEIQGKLGDISGVEVKTLNAFGFKLLRKFYKALGYSKPPEYYEFKQEKQDISGKFDEVFKLVKMEPKQKSGMKKLLFRSIQHDYDMEAHIKKHNPSWKDCLEKLEQLRATIRRSKQKEGKASYGDQLYGARRLLDQSSSALQQIGKQYHMLLVDEFQDLSPVQLDLVYHLAEVIENVVIVGDDAQTIYGFRGARTDSLRRFKDAFKEAELFKLTKSHRCTQETLAVANLIRKDIHGVIETELTADKKGPKPRYVQCKTNERQDYLVYHLIQELMEGKGIGVGEITVLARNHLSLSEVYGSLKRRGVPVLIGNKELLEKACAVVRLFLLVMEGNSDSIARLLDYMDLEVDEDNVKAVKELKAGGNKRLKYLIQRLKKARDSRYWEEKLDLVQECMGYYLEQDKKTLGTYAKQIKARSRHCSEIREVLVVIEEFREAHQECIALQTVHGAKGLEYQAVIIIDMVDGYFPDFRAIGNEETLDDERKLLYVAVTRAKKYLCMISTPYQDYDVYAKKLVKVNWECSLLNQEILDCCVLRE